MATPTRIGAGRKQHLYIEEHMAAKTPPATPASIASRLEIHRATVGKWLKKGQRISLDELERLALALDLESWKVFLRPPGRESVDDLIDDAPDFERETVLQLAKRLKTGRG